MVSVSLHAAQRSYIPPYSSSGVLVERYIILLRGLDHVCFYSLDESDPHILLIVGVFSKYDP